MKKELEARTKRFALRIDLNKELEFRIWERSEPRMNSGLGTRIWESGPFRNPQSEISYRYLSQAAEQLKPNARSFAKSAIRNPQSEIPTYAPYPC
jgi:hypothetical protein